MTKVVKTLQAVVLLVLSLMAFVERDGDGSAKQKEVLDHLKEIFDANQIVLPSWVASLLNGIMPGLISLFAAWVNTNKSIQSLFVKIQGIVLAVFSVLTLFDDDDSNDADLNKTIHTSLAALNITLPAWADSALGVVLPILIGVIKKAIGGANSGK